MKFLKKSFFLCFVVLGGISCSLRPCKDVDTSKISSQKLPKGQQNQRVEIYKPDGSKQCGQGTSISLQDMEKELRGLTLYSKRVDHDGLMRIQVCGAPTGKVNVFEIHKDDLKEAEKRGFQVLVPQN